MSTTATSHSHRDAYAGHPAVVPVGGIDPRGPRFAATVTTLVLAAALLLAASVPSATIALVAVQLVAFALGATLGVRRTPYSWLFRHLVRPRLGAPTELEDARPPRFAQAVGLAFAVLALAGFATGVTLLGEVAVGLALAAAFLNAAFGYCLGCEMYLRGVRLRAVLQNDR
ncbi:MAG TPA: DUF4395 domain-containing protein [Nocardioidaceae bacterium]|nr:DUF4395 domain-containing protein [Nocardioidaceae bacterium]